MKATQTHAAGVGRSRHPLSYCGLAVRDDLEAPGFRDGAAELERRDYGPLRHELRGWTAHWSRIWEYPYAYYAVRDHLQGRQAPVRILDSGCGTTPVPFWLAGDGHEVWGADLDRACEAKWNSADPHVAGKASFVTGDMEQLPFEDAHFDVVYSISALEHVNRPERAAAEMCRVLRPGGLLVLTCDIPITTYRRPLGEEIPAPTFRAVQEILLAHGTPAMRPIWASPSQLLTFQGKRKQDRAGKALPRRALVRALDALNAKRRGDNAIFGLALVRND